LTKGRIEDADEFLAIDMRQFGLRLAQSLIGGLKLFGALKHVRFELVIHFFDFCFWPVSVQGSRSVPSRHGASLWQTDE
jgi:hypothetical protein